MDSSRHRPRRGGPNTGHSRFQANRQSPHDPLNPPRSTPTWGEHIESINMSQPQNMVNSPVGGGTVVNVTVNREDAPARNARHEDFHLTRIPRADHEIYFSQLLTKKRGCPLWVPGPGMQLPIEYRRQGIGIGDIGIITSTGVFDFLFNIFQPADHPTNRGIVPQGFSPLRYHNFVSDIQVTMDYGPDTYLASSCVRKTSMNFDDGTSIINQRFESSANEAAILILPDGATTQNLLNTRGIRSTISSNAKNWYTYARDTRGRDVKNGDIRVVVGFDKVSSWGIATSSCTTDQTSSYVFKPDPIHSYRWDCVGGSGRVGPQKIEIRDLVSENTVPRNQCVFVRTINFTLSGKMWNDFPSEAIQQQSGPSPRKSGRRGAAPSNRKGSGKGHGSSGSGGTSSTGSTQGSSHRMSPNVNFDPVEIGVHHPSTILHNYLHEEFPDANMAITEDKDWISLLSDDDVVFPEPEDLCQRLRKAYGLLNEEGIIRLVRLNDAEHSNLKSANLKRQPAASSSQPRVLIGIMGPTGSGKTTFINSASGSSLLVGKGLAPCTAEVDIAAEFDLDDRRVTLIDTPGFDDTEKSDNNVLNTIVAHLENLYAAGIKLSGLIYVHRISDVRMGGMSVRNFRMFRKLCGDETLKNVVIVTNMWGEVGLAKGEAREAELKDTFFKPALDKGAKMLRHDNTAESAHTILRHIIQNHPLALKIQRELVDENKFIVETAAAEELEGQIQESIRKHQAEMEKLQDEFQEALRTKDVEAKRELEQAKRELQMKIESMRDDIWNMGSKYEDERKRADEYWRESDATRVKCQQQNLLSLMTQMQLDQANVDRRLETMLNDQKIADQKRVDAKNK